MSVSEIDSFPFYYSIATVLLVFALLQTPPPIKLRLIARCFDFGV